MKFICQYCGKEFEAKKVLKGSTVVENVRVKIPLAKGDETNKSL